MGAAVDNNVGVSVLVPTYNEEAEIFAGISDGHFAEWFPARVKRGPARQKSEPWEHLKKKRYSPNAYLNGFSRADYGALFSEFFLILKERVRGPNLGRAFLTPEVSQEVREYPEEELLSNQVLFVLRGKRQKLVAPRLQSRSRTRTIGVGTYQGPETPRRILHAFVAPPMGAAAPSVFALV